VSAASKVRDLKGAHYLTLQQQYGLMLATYKEKPLPATADRMDSSSRESSNVYIMSLEMDGAGACCGLMSPDDRVLEVDGVVADSLQQVTTAFRESRDAVRLKVASRVVFGGLMYKKGELNTSLQLRWFILSDELEGSILRYYDGRNTVMRVLKGEIRVSPQTISMVRTFTHESNGIKRLGVRISTDSRVWELISYRSDADARHWTELLSSRIRVRVHRPTLCNLAEATEAQAAATIGSKEAGVRPQCTRL